MRTKNIGIKISIQNATEMKLACLVVYNNFVQPHYQNVSKKFDSIRELRRGNIKSPEHLIRRKFASDTCGDVGTLGLSPGIGTVAMRCWGRH